MDAVASLLGRQPASLASGISSLVSSLLSSPAAEALPVAQLAPVAVELLQAVRRSVAIAAASSPSSTSSYQRLVANAALIVADVAAALPHTGALVAEVLLSIRQSCCSGGSSSSRYAISDCLLWACQPREDGADLAPGWRYLWALRCLTQQAALSYMRDGIDLGVLLRLATATSSPAGAEGMIAFHALQLFLDQVGAPVQTRESLLEASVPSPAALAELLKGEAELRARADLASATAASSATSSLSPLSLAVDPHGLGTVSLGDATLAVTPPLAAASAGGSGASLAQLAPTPTTLRNLLALARAHSLALPVLLQGPSGCGKTFLLRQLAALVGQPRVVELHLDDQADSKALVGSFICSDIPGEFVWQAGMVTQAALGGHWLVLENVDKVPLDVVAALATLIERRSLYLPQEGREVSCHPHFRIFASRTLAPSALDAHALAQAQSQLPQGKRLADRSNANAVAASRQTNNVPQLRHFSQFFHFVTVAAPAIDEIGAIVETLFPSVLPAARKLLLETYACFGGGSVTRGASSLGGEGGARPAIASAGLRLTRDFTIRDVIKAARRFARHAHVFNTQSDFLTDEARRLLLCEVVDVFAASVRDSALLPPLAHALGVIWRVAPQDVDAGVLGAAPQLHVASSSVTVGRATVLTNPAAAEGHAASAQAFALTRHSLRLLEKLAQCVALAEPVLLVGETGCGKTTSVQELAALVGRKLLVQNLSLSTDSSDLLGGFRPVSVKALFQPTYEKFVDLFRGTFNVSSVAANAEYLQICAQAFNKQQWTKLLRALKKACENATKKLTAPDAPAGPSQFSLSVWTDLAQRVDRLCVSLPKIEHGFAFAFVDGLLVSAMTQGQWVLLDEINLASPEALQGLVGILDGQSLCLTDKGDVVPIERHPDFRVFAAMNPPTDIGKKELPPSIRCRFTELYCDEVLDRNDLGAVVTRCLQGIADAPVDDLVSIYLGCRDSAACRLVDSAGQRPRYTLRSLTRSLAATRQFMAINFRPLSRALFEGLLLNFQTQLDARGRAFMHAFLKDALGVPGGKDLTQPPSRPGGKRSTGADWVLVQPFWLHKGPLPEVDWCDRDERNVSRFVMTPTVAASIRDLAAAVASRVAPILLQGPTSVGKTTMIEYLAARTGHRCIRINNHEHTDTQEYIGSYVTNSTGQLEFKDGLLVEALRGGHWIILDELNLAPSDVLEALNRLLDDNKELYVPETGETVTPSEGFVLFATQNPPGAYGGRKPLSRAFRNRFLELAVCDLPPAEVEEIITVSCGIAPKFSKMLVDTMNELSLRRQQSSLFQGKYGAITTRDLIKWGKRQPQSADAVCREGYMLLAEKLRDAGERQAVQSVLEKVCRVQIDVSSMYDPDESAIQASNPDSALIVGKGEGVASGTSALKDLSTLQAALRQSSGENRASSVHDGGGVEIEGVAGIAITESMRRMWVLVSRSIQHSEPVLLIGDTGCGKTTVCQLLAAHRGQIIRIVNCHQSTESSDIIGGLRPVRNREQLLVAATEKLRLALAALQDLAFRIDVAKCDAVDEPLAGARALLQPTAAAEEGAAGAESLAASLSEVDAKKARDQLLAVQAGLLASLPSTQTPSEAAIEPAPEPVKASKKARKQQQQQLHAEQQQQQQQQEDPQSVLLASAATQAGILLTEASDLLGRHSALFEWVDGPLVQAMKQGHVFVLDEINLADDAVIERLNSVLESSRSITLAEKGGSGGELERITAHKDFQLLATMNPGGDFGKRELSPALRSRFTEIWASPHQARTDLELVVAEVLRLPRALGEASQSTQPQVVAAIMVDFTEWLNAEAERVGVQGVRVANREILAWAKFMSISTASAATGTAATSSVAELAVFTSLLHGALMVVLDGLGLGSTSSRSSIHALVERSVARLLAQCPEGCVDAVRSSIALPTRITKSDSVVTVGTFSIPLAGASISTGSGVATEVVVVNSGSGAEGDANSDGGEPTEGGASTQHYMLSARATLCNLTRILRAMQIHRPILLEGPPGVGKSSIVNQLAKLTGHNLVRINLSEFSELSDLLGTDLPAVGDGSEDASGSGGGGAKFVWCDGVFLSAMKRGDWVLLDELNLAPQTVLEGLNACFDHREEVFLPEIGQTVRPGPGFRVFCAQNPMVEGGGRKGLPASFLSRFSRVYVEAMEEQDMREIALAACTSSSDAAGLAALVPRMVRFIRRLQQDVVERGQLGRRGAPWEFNLRDVFRWLEMTSLSLGVQGTAAVTNDPDSRDENGLTSLERLVGYAADSLFVQRLREASDRDAVAVIFSEEMQFPLASEGDTMVLPLGKASFNAVAGSGGGQILIGQALLSCRSVSQFRDSRAAPAATDGPTERGLFKTVHSLAMAVRLTSPVLLVGATGSGKRSAVRQLASLVGARLVEFSVTASTDSAELLGSFEQTSSEKWVGQGLARAEEASLLLSKAALHALAARGTEQGPDGAAASIARALEALHSVRHSVAHVVEAKLLNLAEGVALFDALQSTLSALAEASAAATNAGFQTAADHERVSASLTQASALLQRAYAAVTAAGGSTLAGGFSWADGVIVRAVEEGHWLLLDNVNLCSASVLDRLNSLLEPGGTLLLTEGGEGREVRPHRDFRIFLCMDPCYGEISRAMRNRCLEICTDAAPPAAPLALIAAHPLSASTPALLAAHKALVAAGEGASSTRALRKVLAWMSFHGQASDPDTAIKSAVPWLQLQLQHQLQGLALAPAMIVDDSEGDHESAAWLHWLGPQTLIHARFLPPVALALIKLLWQGETAAANGQTLLLSAIDGLALASLAAPLNRLEQALRSSVSPTAAASATGTATAPFASAADPFGRAALLIMLAAELAAAGAVPLEFARRLVPPALEPPLGAALAALQGDPLWAALLDSDSGLGALAVLRASRSPLSTAAALAVASPGSSTSTPISTIFALLRSPLPWLLARHHATCLAHTLAIDASPDNSTSGAIQSASAFATLAQAGDRVSSGLVVADTRELVVLARFSELAESARAAISAISGAVAGSLSKNDVMDTTDGDVPSGNNASVETVSALVSQLLPALERLVERHATLLRVLGQPFSAELPWDDLVIALRWLHKTAFALKRALAGTEAESPVLSITQAQAILQRSLAAAVSAVNTYFHSAMSLHKLRLWKEGGHAAVPAKRSDWVPLLLLRSAVSWLPPVRAPLALLVESRLPRVEPFDWPATQALLREWLALYATCYFQSTGEARAAVTGGSALVVSGKGRTRVDLSPLVAALQTRFEFLRQDLCPTEEEEAVDDMALEEDDEGKVRFRSSNRLQATIDREERLSTALPVALIAEGALATALAECTSMLASVITLGSATASAVNDREATRLLRQLREALALTLTLGLGHGLLDPCCLREVQTLLWCLEAEPAETQADISAPAPRVLPSALLALAPSVLHALDCALHALAQRSFANNLEAVAFSYSSASLRELLYSNAAGRAKGKLGYAQGQGQDAVVSVLSLRDSLLSGPTRLPLQLVSLESVLPFIDVRALVPGAGTAAGMSLLSHGAAHVSVKSVMGAKAALWRLFRALVMTAGNAPDSTASAAVFSVAPTSESSSSGRGASSATYADSAVAALTRLPLLRLLALQVVTSCRDLYSDADTVLSVAEDATGSGGVFAGLAALDLASLMPAGEVAALFARLLQPVLEFLAATGTESNAGNSSSSLLADSARAWVRLSLLRLHLLLPPLPVDPAAKPAAKSRLLASSTNELSAHASALVTSASLAHEPIATPASKSACEALVATDAARKRLRARVIERPEEAESFADLHAVLVDGCGSVGDVARVEALADCLLSALSVLTQPSTSGKAAPDAPSLEQLLSQEVTWQASCASLTDRLARTTGFDDVTVVVRSALAGVAGGLRVLASAVAEGLSASQAASAAAGGGGWACGLAEAWKSLLQFPHSSAIALAPAASASASTSAQAVQLIDELLQSSEHAAARAAARATAIAKAGGSAPSARAIGKVALSQVLLLALCRIDYLVGGGTVASPAEVSALFQKILTRFVEGHLQAQAEKKHREAVENAMFRNRAQESTFEANDEKEEEAALLTHFPDHLRAFRDVLAAANKDPAAAADADLQSGPEAEAEAENEAEAEGVDQHTLLALVGFHARMVFLHYPAWMRAAGLVWVSSGGSRGRQSLTDITAAAASATAARDGQVAASGFGWAADSRAERLARTRALSRQSLVVARCLSLSAGRCLAPGLAAQISGGCLMALAEMAASLSPSRALPTLAAPPAAAAPVAAKKKVSFKKGGGGAAAASSSAAGSIDRDLLWLLQTADALESPQGRNSRSRSHGPNSSASQYIRPPDFHKDALPHEAAAAAAPVEGIFRKALYLLTLHPNNEIIEQIAIISGRILDFHVSTPLGKLLVSVQLLLRQVSEWESYAARHVSMEEQVGALRQLITRWRELELQSWDELLRCKEVEYATAAAGHWFSLVRALWTPPELVPDEVGAGAVKAKARVHGSIAAASPTWLLYNSPAVATPATTAAAATAAAAASAAATATAKPKGRMTVSEYAAKVFSLLDGFLSGSNAGQFPTRLHLVRLLALQLQQECVSAGHSAATATPTASGVGAQGRAASAAARSAKQRAAHLAFGLWHYYHQFLPLVRTFTDTLLGPILTKLRDEVRISKWDTMSSYALVEHSDRIHRKLNKLIREYQGDALEFPLQALLRREIMGGLASKTGELVAATAVPSLAEIFPRCELGRAAAKLLGSAAAVEVASEAALEKQLAAAPADAVSPPPAVQAGLAESPSLQRLLKAPAMAAKAAKYLRAAFLLPPPAPLPEPEPEPAPVKGKASKMQLSGKGGEEGDENGGGDDDAEEDNEDGEEEDEYDEDDEAEDQVHLRFLSKVRHGSLAAAQAERLCLAVFSRLSRLKSPDIPKAAKHRAVSDLLQELKRQGVSHLRSRVPQEQKDMAAVLGAPAPLACETASDLSSAIDSSSVGSGSGSSGVSSGSSASTSHAAAGISSSTLGRGEAYYLRVLTELNQLRSQALSPSAHDVSAREIALMLGFSENLFLQAARQRLVLFAALADYRALFAAIAELSAKVEAAGQTASGSGAVDSLGLGLTYSAARQSLSVLLDSCLQLHALVEVATQAQAQGEGEGDALPSPLDSASCAAVVAAAGALVDAAERARDSLEVSGSGSVGGGGDLPDSMASLFGLSLAPLSSSISGSASSASLSPAALAALSAALRPAAERWALLEARAARLVGWPVLLAVRAQLQGLADCFSLAQATAAEPSTSSVPATATATASAPADGASGAAVAVLARAVDGCLVSVQRLRALRLPSDAGPALDQRAAELVQAAFASPISQQQQQQPSADGGDAMATEAQGGDGGEGSDNAPSLNTSQALAIATVAAIDASASAAALRDLSLGQALALGPADLALAAGALPLFRLQLAALGVAVRDLGEAYRAGCKLLYVLVRVFRVLLAKGLCSDETKDEDGDGEGAAGDMKFSDDHEGTGMGEGEGKKDVSDQIENEDQLMGLKDEEKEEDEDQQAGQPPQKKQLSEEEKDSGVEISQDFEGDMFDLPEEDEERQKDEEEEEEDEGEELDREMGAGDDAEVVDERAWDSSDDEDDGAKDGEEKMERDSKMEGETIEGETHTKDNDDDEDGAGGDEKDKKQKQEEEEKEKEQQPKPKPGADDDQEDDEDGEGKVNEDREDKYSEKPQGIDVRQEEEENKDDGDAGEQGQDQDQDQDQDQEQEQGADEGALPDDMNLDGPEDGEGEGEAGPEDLETPDPEAGDETMEASGDEEEGEGEGKDDEEKEEDDKDQMDAAAGEGNLADPAAEPPQPDDALAQPEEDQQPQTKPSSAQKPPAYGVKAGTDSTEAVLGTEDDDADKEEQDGTKPQPPVASDGPEGRGGSGTDSGDRGAAREVGDSATQRPQQPQQRPPPNPFKQRGDLSREWHRRLNIVEPADPRAADAAEEDEDDDQDEDGGRGDGRGEFEFRLDKDDQQQQKQQDKQGGPQVLSDVAKDEDATALPEDQKTEAEKAAEQEREQQQQQQQQAGADRMMEDEPDGAEDAAAARDKKRDRRRDAAEDEASRKRRREREGEENQAASAGNDVDADDEEGAGAEGQGQAASDNEDESEDEDGQGGDQEGDDGAAADAYEPRIHTAAPRARDWDPASASAAKDKRGDDDEDDADPDSAAAALQLALSLDDATGDAGGASHAPLSVAQRDLWARHRRETDTLSLRLCEQLRLILEPTQATRLQGDFRTGKRISMRKVIGYIASGFRKDKIWLRRTKPAKREYQVMVMIDDSKSMGAAGPLALSALATMATALSRLEVGELAVCSFAERVSLLHPFWRPWSEDAGARVMASFGFTEGQTRLGASLEAVESVFLAARSGSAGGGGGGSSGAQVLQLCFVVSDARIDSENREALDGTVRRLSEQNILVVLIIIDKNADAKDSIFNTRSVEFRGDRVVTTAYLDNFPFPYYLAIQRLEALPDVLCEALKGWFELVNAQLKA